MLLLMVDYIAVSAPALVVVGGYPETTRTVKRQEDDDALLLWLFLKALVDD